MRGRKTGLTAVWLLLLTAVQAAGVAVLWRFAVGTERGQLLDTIALDGNTIGRDQIDQLVDTVLNAMSVLSLLGATAFIGFIALIRRRIALAVLAIVLIIGANLTTQVLKQAIQRPDLGIDPERAGAGNSLPSGHTTVAASVALALVLVLPPRLRVWGALLGAGYAAVAGVATLSAGWHRPSDGVAAILIAGAWAALAGFTLLLAQRKDAEVAPQDAHRVARIVLAVGGAVLLAVAGVAFGWADQAPAVPPEQLGPSRLYAAYVGSAAGIAGVMSLVMAAVLLTVHRVVPRHTG